MKQHYNDVSHNILLVRYENPNEDDEVNKLYELIKNLKSKKVYNAQLTIAYFDKEIEFKPEEIDFFLRVSKEEKHKVGEIRILSEEYKKLNSKSQIEILLKKLATDAS